MQSDEMHPRNPAATPSVFYPQAFYFSELGAEISRICDLHLFWPKRPRRFVAVRCWAVWGCTGSRRLWSEFQRVLWRIICLFARLDIWPFFWNRRLVYEFGQIHLKGLNKFWDSPADRLGLLTSVLLYEDKVVMTWSSSWAQNCCVSLAFDAISFMRMLPSKVWETYTRPTLTRSSPPGFGWVDSPDVKLHCFHLFSRSGLLPFCTSIGPSVSFSIWQRSYQGSCNGWATTPGRAATWSAGPEWLNWNHQNH